MSLRLGFAGAVFASLAFGVVAANACAFNDAASESALVAVASTDGAQPTDTPASAPAQRPN